MHVSAPTLNRFRMDMVPREEHGSMQHGYQQIWYVGSISTATQRNGDRAAVGTDLVEGGGDPDLVHGVASGRVLRGQPVRLEHGAADGVHGARVDARAGAAGRLWSGTAAAAPTRLLRSMPATAYISQ